MGNTDHGLQNYETHMGERNTENCLNPCLAEPGYALSLQTMQIQISWFLKNFINNLDQVIWFAENWEWTWHHNLFSMARFNFGILEFCYLTLDQFLFIFQKSVESMAKWKQRLAISPFPTSINQTTLQHNTPGPEVIKLFSCSTQLSMKFSLLINMKMLTIVGIFIFISREIFMLSYV